MSITRGCFEFLRNAHVSAGLVGVLLFYANAPASAQATCGKPPVEIFVDGFRDLPYPPAPPPPPPVVLPPEATPLAVAITSPSNGHSTRRSEIEVRGTFSGPPNTGIRINGRAPLVHGNQFVLPNLKIPPGASTIEARVESMAGSTLTATANVTVDSGAPVEPLTLAADRAGGFAPMPVTFSWTTASPTTFAQLQFDFDGDGNFDLDTANVNSTLRFNYSTPGVYTARIRLTTPAPEGLAIEATRQVVSINSNYTRATLCYVFERMRSKLAASDVSGALESLHAELRPRFNSFWTANLAQLPTMAAQLGEVADGMLGRDTAQLMITRPVEGQSEPSAFFVNFEQDIDGVWSITGM